MASRPLQPTLGLVNWLVIVSVEYAGFERIAVLPQVLDLPSAADLSFRLADQVVVGG